MSLKPDFSGQYSSHQDELLIYEGDQASSIILMLKGKIDVYLSPYDVINKEQSLSANSAKLFSIEQNTFLGINDILGNGKNSFSLKTGEASNLFCFAASSSKAVKDIISNQKDYSAYIVSSLATLIDLIYISYQKLQPICREIDALTQNLSLYYWAIKDKFYFHYSANIENLDTYHLQYETAKNDFKFFPFDSELSLGKHIICSETGDSNDIDSSGIEYFSRLLNIPLDSRKSFFNSDDYVCEYHIQNGSEIFNSLIDEIKAMLSVLYKNISLLYWSENSLLSAYGRIAADSKDDKEAAKTIFGIFFQSVDILKHNIEKLQRGFDCFTNISSSGLQALVNSTRANAEISSAASALSSLSAESLPSELENSLEKILEYCSCSQETIDSFNKRLNKFRMLKDKSSSEPDVRELRASITRDFFTFYEEAFKRSQTEDNCPKLICMFINFGYMDERLVTQEQALALYRLCDKAYGSSDYSIYSAKKWLEMIYQNKKEPSINDFGQDYFDIFRDMKKRKLVSDQDKTAYDRDFKAKVNFEINNMLKTNQKVCHGHISSYFPILHRDIITRDLEKSIVTPAHIKQALDNILATDFSIFYREIRYKNDQKGIEKEAIMKEILPDIIIVPTFGSRASMWQEITGRGRNTPGRFILPAFTDENLPEMILKLVGAFRWELCRTMMGVAWNDITEKSLTSEYTDYIQFYKKNHDLSEDAKGKIKAQIQKTRNVMRDIFISDYETWINYESKGILRLNKIVRSILFRYCPASREMRNALAKQPAFSDLLMQLNSARAKTAKSLAGKYEKLFKNEPLDKDLEMNLIFYRDL